MFRRLVNGAASPLVASQKRALFRRKERENKVSEEEPKTDLTAATGSDDKPIPQTETSQAKRPARPKSKTVAVTLLGATHNTAQMLGLKLKTNRLIKELRLYDKKGTRSVALDAKHISSPCRVSSFVGENQMRYALKKVDIVVIVGGATLDAATPVAEILNVNAPLVKEYAKACVKSCPEAVFAIMVEPINCTVPLFAEVLRHYGVFCPNRVLGLVSLEVMRTRTLVANKLGLDPQSIKAHVVGGATPKTIVPVVSGANPGGEFLLGQEKELITKIRNMSNEVTMANKGKAPGISTGYAASIFIDTLAKGLCSKAHEPFPAYVRTTTLPSVPYLVTPLRFGPGGVRYNLGLPRLSDYEVSLLEESIPTIQEDIIVGQQAADVPLIDKCSKLDILTQHRELRQEVACGP